MSSIPRASRSKVLFGVVAVTLVILGFLVVWLTQESPTHFQKEIQEGIAINIAWTELIKRFPDGKSLDSTYAMYDVRPRPDKGPTVWEVTYDLLSGTTDQTIWITVDTETKKVLLFYQAQS